MVDALIFSRDRPMQLTACLDSLLRHVPLRNVVVLWKATNDSFRHGYEIAETETRVAFVEEKAAFSEEVRTLLHDLGSLVLLQCDDSITYAPLPTDPADAMQDDVFAFNLRLGANTHYCHPRDLLHDVPPLTPRGPFVVWDWHDTPEGPAFEWEGREGDFGYPYSLDGAIHRRDSILEWVGGHTFENPNRMEGCVVGAIGQRRDVPPLLASFPRSVQVGLPVNVVNQTHGNRFGLDYFYETAELNDRFLAGERIRWQEMDYSEIIGAHQELELVIR